MMRCVLAFLLAFCLSSISARPADAYDAQPVHRWLMRMAIERLVEAYPGQYDELLEYLDRLVDGAEHEDDLILDGDDDPTTLRVERHFYRPTDGAGLAMDDEQFPSSYAWGVLPSEGNQWGWDDAMEAYRKGDLEEAMFALGHVVHLVQDLTVPAHTHLDVHGPPYGDDYEVYCTAQTPDEHTSYLPLPPEGAPIPQFANALAAWQATSEASYYRNLYPGDLSDRESPAGVISEMYPDLSFSWYSQEWTIGAPPVGSLGSDFVEEQPGWFYFENTEYPASVDALPTDGAGQGSVAYGPNATGASMMELFARDLIPVAIMNSAGVMKLFLDEAHELEPESPGEPDSEEMAQGCSSAPAPSSPLIIALVVAGLVRRRTRCAL